MTAIVWTATEQWGVAIGTAWATLVPSDNPLTNVAINFPATVRSGQIFDANSFQSLETMVVDGATRLADPPRVAAPTLILHATRPGGGGNDRTLRIFADPDPSPADWASNSPNAPGTRNERLIREIVLEGLQPNPTTTRFEIELPDLLAWNLSDPAWNGRVALMFESADFVIHITNGPSTLAMQIETDQVPFFNGLAGGPTGARQRFVRDARFGMPALNQDLVRDGNNPGLFVRAEDWDPEDPPARYRPRRGEGTVDDGIPE